MESDCSNEEVDILSSGQSKEPSTLEYGSLSPHISTERLMESPRPGPSGINQPYENEDIQVDSDDSIEIIEVPKKPVPIIVLSDSNSDSEIDVIEVDVNPKDIRVKSIKERLEEQKSKIFAVKVEAENGGESPPNKHDVTCSICLGIYQNRAFLDECFHSFCYTCILQWAKVVHTCPLCKTAFKSIIHDIKPDLDYKQDFMNKSGNSTTETSSTGTFDSWMDTGHRFRYRTTLTSVGNYISDWFRQRRYESFRTSSSVPYRRRLERRSWGRRLPSAPGHAGEERRRSVYRCGLVIKEVKHPPGRVKYRDISVQFFKQNPAISHRLVPWILRDLKVLLGYNSNDASVVLHLIMSLLQRYPMDSNEFYNQLQPYLYDNTRQFIRELISFASSPYDMQTYDSRVVYDFQPTMQSIATSTAPRPASELQSQTYTDFECEITFRDRLLDEMFDESRNGTSLPYNPSYTILSPTRHHGSPTYHPSNVQEDRSTLEDQGWNSSDSVIDVTGTNSLSRASYNMDSGSDLDVLSERDVGTQREESPCSSRKGIKANRGGDKRSSSRRSVISENGSSPEMNDILSCASENSARHMAYDADNVYSRRRSCGPRSSSDSRKFFNVSCGQEDSFMEWDTQSSIQQHLSSKSRDSSRLQKRSKYVEKHRKSRRSTSKSRETNDKSACIVSNGKEHNHLYRKSYSSSKSYGDMSRSRSNRRSKSRSRDSSKFLNVSRTRSREREKNRRSRSSRSKSKEFTELSPVEDSKSRRLKKSGDTKSPRPRKSSNHSYSSRNKSKTIEEKDRSPADLSFTKEPSNRTSRTRSRSRESNWRKIFKSSRSGSRESSYSSVPARSMKTGEEYKSRSSKPRSSRSRLSRSRSRDTHKSKSKTSKRHEDSVSSTSRSRDSSSYSESRLRKTKKKSRKCRSRSKESSDFSMEYKCDISSESVRGSNAKKHSRRVFHKEKPMSRDVPDPEADHRKGDGSKENSPGTLIHEKLNGEGSTRKDNENRGSIAGTSVALQQKRRQVFYIDGDSSRKSHGACATQMNEKDGVELSRTRETNHVKSILVIEGGKSWSGNENRTQGINADGIDDGNDIGDRKETVSQKKLDHGSAIGNQDNICFSKVARGQSPEYNPVKIPSPKKNKIVKLKRRPYVVKTIGDTEHGCGSANERKYVVQNFEGEGGPVELLSESSSNVDNRVDPMTTHGIETCEDTSSGTETASMKQIRYSSVNNLLGITGEKHDDAVPGTSGHTDVDASKVTYTEPTINSLNSGTVTLHVTEGTKDFSSKAALDMAKSSPSTVSTNQIASESHNEAISAAAWNKNYLSTIAVIPSLPDNEIEASIRELDHRILLSKEALRDFSKK